MVDGKLVTAYSANLPFAHATLPTCHENCKGDLIAVMNLCFEPLKGSDVPSVHENDAAFLQGKIFLEDAFPRPFVVSLKDSKDVSQVRGFQVQSDRPFQRKFGSKYVCNDRHGRSIGLCWNVRVDVSSGFRMLELLKHPIPSGHSIHRSSCSDSLHR